MKSTQNTTMTSPPQPWHRPDLTSAQRRLAEISTLIHTSSIFHDDVIDGAQTCRGVPTIHLTFGNKVAILAGNYLLVRASISLTRLRDVDVLEIMSGVINHLVKGDIMLTRGVGGAESGGDGDGNESPKLGEKIGLRRRRQRSGRRDDDICVSRKRGGWRQSKICGCGTVPAYSRGGPIDPA